MPVEVLLILAIIPLGLGLSVYATRKRPPWQGRLMVFGVVVAGIALMIPVSVLGSFQLTSPWLNSAWIVWPLGMVGVALMVWSLPRRARVGNCCAQCEYDLAGLGADAPCPECGSTERTVDGPPVGPLNRRRLTAGALCVLLGFAVLTSGWALISAKSIPDLPTAVLMLRRDLNTPHRELVNTEILARHRVGMISDETLGALAQEALAGDPAATDPDAQIVVGAITAGLLSHDTSVAFLRKIPQVVFTVPGEVDRGRTFSCQVAISLASTNWQPGSGISYLMSITGPTSKTGTFSRRISGSSTGALSGGGRISFGSISMLTGAGEAALPAEVDITLPIAFEAVIRQPDGSTRRYRWTAEPSTTTRLVEP